MATHFSSFLFCWKVKEKGNTQRSYNQSAVFSKQCNIFRWEKSNTNYNVLGLFFNLGQTKLANRPNYSISWTIIFGGDSKTI